MAWSLSRKVSVALLGILLSTMVMTGAFGYYKFQSVLSDQVNSRYSFVVFTIKRKIEDRLALGLALRALRQIQELAELEKARDSQILGIQIYDSNREVLFDTDRGTIGSRVPSTWLEPLSAQGTQPFSLTDEDSALVGLPLVNTLGKVEGAVVLRYPATYLEQELGRLLQRLAGEFAVVLLGSAVLSVIAASWLLRDVRQRLVAMENTLNQSVTKGAPAKPGRDAFEGDFVRFCGKAREAVEQIGEASDEVERLDRLA
ncbi:hypothetical protein [Magnetospirillum aberrantis]|uniref:Uncharacterized protein n=1 Tax=Magnetospirillum aberrantis SpK TaxID=908842 RepID=A0A7C9QS51_9PROT|nr:hypothetical protein [Magnetospirillum aberrantis]NFV78859.1 hypothetical protein [Magnetospirillum aberrantis SpK]